MLAMSPSLMFAQNEVNQSFLTVSSNSIWQAIREWKQEGQYPGEPVFVRRPKGQPENEDEGILLSVVLDAPANNSYLLLLDARDLSEIARARVPQHVPFGFHVAYVRS